MKYPNYVLIVIEKYAILYNIGDLILIHVVRR